MKDKSNQRIIILGAGVTGLALGKLFTEDGWKVTLLEKENIIGGLAATVKWGEFNLDFGPHIYHATDKDLEAFWEREFGDLFVKKEFWCKNVQGKNFDEYHDYPLSYEAINEYPAPLKKKILKELEEVSESERAEAKSYQEYVKALVGPTLQKMFFENYPQKIWGIPTHEMTANWAPKRVEIREKRTPFYTGRWNAVGKYGCGCVLERMAQQIKKLGGEILLGCGVEKIEYQDTEISALKLSNGKTIEIGPDDMILSTIPLNVLAGFFNIKHELKFRGVITVSLAFDQPHVIPDDLSFLYYDSSEIIFHRISEQKKFSSAGFPKERTFVTAEIAYSKGDDYDKTDSEVLIQRVLKDVIKVGLAKKGKFIKGKVMKRPCVYPLLGRDYEHKVREVQSKLVKFKSLYMVGGPAEYNYSDMHINFLKAMDLFNTLTDQHADFYKIRRDRQITKQNSVVSLNGKKVGEGQKPFVIAEAGLNHNGSVELGLKLIEEAKRTNCDAVKFQTFRAADRVSNKMKKARYAEQITGLEENIFELFERLELSVEDHQTLFDYGKKIGIDVFSTPFGTSSVDLLESLNTPYYKIASSDLNNLQLLAHVAQTGKPMILSTGMSTLGEIEESINAILDCGNPNIILLHCLSSYPANPEEMNLNVIKTLKSNYHLPVGFSDHAPGIAVSSASLVVGANIIERHFTLDKTMEGPDHVFSSEPEEMGEFTRFASMVNLILGDGMKRIQPSEYDTINSFKKSIYANSNLKKGETITEEMLTIKGPAGGLQPKYWPVLLGRKLKKDIESDYPITWDDI